MIGAHGGRIHVRAVRRTGRYQDWLPVLEALQGTETRCGPDEHAFGLGAGWLVLRPVSQHAPAAQHAATTIEFGVPGDAAGPSDTPVAAIAGPDGMTIQIVRTPEPARSDHPSPVSVCPLWMTADVPGATAAVRSAGLAVRLASDAGQWVDLVAPGGGLVAVHADTPIDRTGPAHAVVAFEAPDIVALADRFADRGLRADIVDEAYGRSLRIDDPDGGGELWVNETMTDLYGYRLMGSA